MPPETPQAPYIGRFAPSPSGPLHLGSLLAAVASYLDARAHHGTWLVRMEDLDPPREAPGAQEEILRALEAHGLIWDENVVRQSERGTLYEDALAKLFDLGVIYRCICTRRQLEGAVYPGTCRDREVSPDVAHALRVNVANAHIEFADANYGPMSQDLATAVGDFIVRRRDGLHAYQLAVVVDDAAQGITHVVRGADLLDNTPRQIYLQRLLELSTPGYLHVPVLTNADGVKLSKQTGATGLEPTRTRENIAQVLTLLGLAPPAHVRRADPSEQLGWATQHWSRTSLPRRLDPQSP